MNQYNFVGIPSPALIGLVPAWQLAYHRAAMIVANRISLGTALLCCCCCRQALADQPEMTPQPGVLVLRSGRLLRGDIIRVADRFVVALGRQDQVSIPVDRVAMRCNSLEEAYQRKRQALGNNTTVGEQLELGDWCLRYGLLSAAADQLLEAMRVKPNDARLTVFEKRLRLAAHQSRDATKFTPKHRSEFVPESILDQTLQGIPPEAVEQFTTVIQPLLLNNCSASQCHGSRHEGPLRLLRPPGNHPISRRFTQRNLYATLSQCDRQSPSQSPLLLRATAAHAGAHRPVLGLQSTRQRQTLTIWLQKLADTQSNVHPAALDTQSPLLSQPSHKTPTRPPHRTRASTVGKPAAAVVERPPSAAKRHDPASERDEGTVPVDPFDPAVFNRRYAKRSADRT